MFVSRQHESQSSNTFQSTWIYIGANGNFIGDSNVNTQKFFSCEFLGENIGIGKSVTYSGAVGNSARTTDNDYLPNSRIYDYDKVFRSNFWKG